MVNEEIDDLHKAFSHIRSMFASKDISREDYKYIAKWSAAYDEIYDYAEEHYVRRFKDRWGSISSEQDLKKSFENLVAEFVDENQQRLNEEPAKGKKFSKTVTDKKTGRKKKVSYGAKGYKIAPGTKKGDSYCARSYGIKKGLPKDKQNDPNTPNNLSRKKWKCKGKKSMREQVEELVNEELRGVNYHLVKLREFFSGRSDFFLEANQEFKIVSHVILSGETGRDYVRHKKEQVEATEVPLNSDYYFDIEEKRRKLKLLNWILSRVDSYNERLANTDKTSRLYSFSQFELLWAYGGKELQEEMKAKNFFKGLTFHRRAQGDFSGTSFEDCSFQSVKFIGNFQNCNFTNARFLGDCDFSEGDFRYSTLKSVSVSKKSSIPEYINQMIRSQNEN